MWRRKYWNQNENFLSSELNSQKRATFLSVTKLSSLYILKLQEESKEVVTNTYRCLHLFIQMANPL